MWLKYKLNLVRLVRVVVLTKIGARFAPNVPQAQKSLWTHPTELLGDVGLVEFQISVHLETVLVSVQDRCRVCAKHTTGSKIVLDAPDVGLVESRFSLYGYSVSVGARWVQGLRQTY
jgi:hypothetical protein